MIKTIGMLVMLAAFFTAGPMGVMTSGAAEARTCKAKYVRSWGKQSRTMFGARASARLAWKRASRSLNGRRYDSWWASRRKSMRCHTNNRGQKRCLAGALPCTVY